MGNAAFPRTTLGACIPLVARKHRSLIIRTFCLALTIGAHSPLAANPDVFGTASLGKVYSSSEIELTDVDIHSTAILPRLTAGVRFGDSPTQTQIQVTTAYSEYLSENRENRWYNSLAVSQRVPFSKGISLNLRIGGASNMASLESRSLDQLSGSLELELRPSNADRITIGGALTRRYYDGSTRNSWAPYLDVEYRRRVGRRKYVQFDARKERVEADDKVFNYERLSTSFSYSQPIAPLTTLGLSLDWRQWTWHGRFTADSANRRDSLLMPGVRINHDISRRMELDLQLRRLIRRSTDDRFDRKGNRVAATLRVSL